ncbi:MAG: hypothetical protein KC776_35215 [Myxococcales bacterium]|nr:hypothetical protein [Myxococcales bacterium]MCB9578681.1 hypothetical protein [Polyangiaceae bacterium]
MHWRWLFITIVVGGCTFELAPLEEKKPPPAGGGSGGTAAVGGLVDAGCTTIGCSNTGGTPSGGTSGGGTGGAGLSGGTGGGTGGAPAFTCVDVNTIPGEFQVKCWAQDQASCSCLGCDNTYCYDPANGDPVSDCTCPSCWNEAYCYDYCENDGVCNPFYEGCGCQDCWYHPSCNP